MRVCRHRAGQPALWFPQSSPRWVLGCPVTTQVADLPARVGRAPFTQHLPVCVITANLRSPGGWGRPPHGQSQEQRCGISDARPAPPLMPVARCPGPPGLAAPCAPMGPEDSESTDPRRGSGHGLSPSRWSGTCPHQVHSTAPGAALSPARLTRRKQRSRAWTKPGVLCAQERRCPSPPEPNKP